MRTLLLAAALAAAAAVPVHDARVQASMAQVVGPASGVLFAVGGEADPDNDPKPVLAPARWDAGAEAADRLRDAAKLMLQPDVVQAGSWRTDAQAMADLSAKAAAAARAKDGKALTQAANDLGDTCTSCHARYKAQS